MLFIWLMVCLFIVPTLGLLLIGWIWADLNNRWPAAIGLILIIIALGVSK